MNSLAPPGHAVNAVNHNPTAHKDDLQTTCGRKWENQTISFPSRLLYMETSGLSISLFDWLVKKCDQMQACPGKSGCNPVPACTPPALPALEQAVCSCSQPPHLHRACMHQVLDRRAQAVTHLRRKGEALAATASAGDGVSTKSSTRL